MKFSLTLVILSLYLCLPFLNQIQAQCTFTQPNLVIFSQDDLNNFPINHPDCTELDANILIWESIPGDITDLTPLSQLIRVNGYILIQQNTALQSLNGFHNLEYLEGRLEIHDNPILEEVSFNKIDTIGEINIYSSPELSTLNFNELKLINGDFILQSAQKVTSLQGFSNLEKVNGAMKIFGFPLLSSYEGFENLKYINTQLQLSNNDLVSDLTGLSGLDSIKNFLITNHNGLTSLNGLSNTIFINALKISDNPLLTNCVIDPVCNALALGNSDGFFGISNNGGAQCLDNDQVLADCSGVYQVPIQVYSDNNQNAQYDAADSLLSGFQIELVGQDINAFSSTENACLFNLETGTYQVRFVEENHPNWQLTTANSSINFTQISGGISDTLRFGITPISANSEIITYIREVPAVCFQHSILELTAHNFGTTTASGTLWIQIDEQANDFTFSNPPDEMPTSHLLGWHFTNLKPNRVFKQTVELPIPQINSLYGNALINGIYATYEDENGNQTSPSYKYTPLVSCNFEANALRISPNQPSNLTPNYVLPDEYIFYTIDFENTTNEIVKDVLVEQNLDVNFDWNSLKILNTNHSNFLQTHLSDNGNLQLLFKGVFMEADGTGVIQIALKPKSNLPDSTLLYLNSTVKFGDFGSLSLSSEEAVFIQAYPTQCLFGTTWIDRQTRIDLFAFEYPYCTTVMGTLDVQDGFAFPINNFDGFAQIDSIYGNLLVQKNNELLNFNGFDKLKYIGGNLLIDENEVFENLVGFGNLKVEGNVNIWDNPKLKNLEGIQNLNAIEQDLSIQQSPKLETLEAVADLDYINGRLGLQGCLILENLTGLENFTSLGGFSMTYCPMVSDISALSNIETLANSGLFLKFNSSLPNLNALSNLTTTGNGNLWIENNDLLIDFSGLNNLETVGGRVYIIGNDGLTSLEGFNSLTTVGEDFTLNSPILSDIMALSSLTHIGDDLHIYSFELESLEGLENLESIGDQLIMNSNPKLSNCAVEGICNHLQNGGNYNIVNNAVGCASAIEILDNCEDVYKVYSRIFYDENQNGMRDPNEAPLSNISMDISPINQVLISSQTDINTNYLDPGNYAFSIPTSNNPLWDVTTLPIDFALEIVDADHPDTLTFGLYPNQIISQIQPIINSAQMRCDSEVTLTINIQNTGTTIIENGKIWLQLDDRILGSTFLDIPDEIINDYQLNWNFSTLYPSQNISKEIQIELPGITVIDVDEPLFFTASAEFEDIAGSHLSTPFDYTPKFVCAFDPNDKLISPDRTEGEVYREEVLTYTIRFQNTGNAPAFDVVLRDTLDADLDISTFRVLSTSHPEVLTTTLEDNQFLTFNFKHIFLPDSLSDPSGSQGYVSYQILPIEGLPYLTTFHNTASIYFDSNPPIVTNTTNNILTMVLSTTEPSSLNYSVYPVPAQAEVVIQFEDPISSNIDLRFFDSTGKLYSPEYQIDNSKIIFDLRGLPEGIWTFSTVIHGELIQGKVMILR